MTEGLFTMSEQEITRLSVIQKLVEKHITQAEAARLLGLSVRQIKRLVKKFRVGGHNSLISNKRGKASNRKHPDEHKICVMAIVAEKYSDFGPTFAAEKLSKLDNRQINKETLREWMIEAGLWKPKRRKQAKTHQSRIRRPCLGELIQIDGSPHDWFEGRSERCTLLVYIDDATSQIVHLRFEKAETTWGYMNATRDYITLYGRPMAFYSDKHSVFKNNTKESLNELKPTQFSRAMNELGIKMIYANSPQAKGRVERANQTLQDRLVKEMRLLGINNIADANHFLPSYLATHNEQFSVEPASQVDAHRELGFSNDQLDMIFTIQCERKLSKNLELSYENVIYQVQVNGAGYTLRQATIKICEDQNGEVKLLYKDKILNYKTHKKQSKASKITSSKEVNAIVDEIVKQDGRSKGKKLSSSHPWLSRGRTQLTMSQMTQA